MEPLNTQLLASFKNAHGNQFAWLLKKYCIFPSPEKDSHLSITLHRLNHSKVRGAALMLFRITVFAQIGHCLDQTFSPAPDHGLINTHHAAPLLPRGHWSATVHMTAIFQALALSQSS